MLLFLLFVVIAVAVLIIIGYFQPFGTESREVWIFSFSLLATFLGVVAAIYLNNVNIDRQDKKAVVNLLISAEENSKRIGLDTNVIEYQIKNYKPENKVDESSSESLSQFFSLDSALPYPIIFDKILEDDKVLRYISSDGVNVFYDSQRNIQRLEKDITSSISSNVISKEDKIKKLANYRKHIEYINKILNLEIKYLKNGISEEDLKVEYEDHGIELLGLNRQQYEEITKELINKISDNK